MAVSYFVDTDKEKVEKRTKQVVESVEKGDWSKFQSLLHPQASLKVAKKKPAAAAISLSDAAVEASAARANSTRTCRT